MSVLHATCNSKSALLPKALSYNTTVMKPWPLFLTHTVITSREINAPLDHVLKAIQDPKTLIESNPLVIGFTLDPTSGWYSIKDKMVMLGQPYTLTYRAKFNNEEDGMSSYVEAGSGVTIRGRWKAEVIQNGEQSTVRVTDADAITVCQLPDSHLPGAHDCPLLIRFIMHRRFLSSSLLSY